jgi:hypothetical protein
MELTPSAVAAQAVWTHDRATVVVPLVNQVREELGAVFETAVDPITEQQYHDVVETVFADGDRAVNVAALVAILRDLDVTDDYPGFVIDEMLARELAATIAGQQPLRLLAEATFHYVDVHHHGDTGDPAGLDDLDAALAAGVQTRLPGWDWQDGESPFDVGPSRS